MEIVSRFLNIVIHGTPLQVSLWSSVPPVSTADVQSTVVGTRGKAEIKEYNSSEKIFRERSDDDTGVRVNEGLDPVTCRVIRRSMMQCVDGLKPLCYCSPT